MSLDNAVGLVLAVAVLGYLVYALLVPERPMTWHAWLQLAVLIGLVLATAPLLGAYLARVFGGGSAPGDRVFLPVERLLYRVRGCRPGARAAVAGRTPSRCSRSAPSPSLGLYLLQRVQGDLPLNPTDVDGGAAGARVQHCGQLRHEHELAELRAAS